MLKTINIGICDDDAFELDIISQAVMLEFQKAKISPSIRTYTNPSDLAKELHDLVHYDVLFLDIDMPFINGLELAALAKSLSPTPIIVFISSKEEYVFQAFKVQPFRFICKSTFRKDIEECITMLISEISKKLTSNYINISSQHSIYRLNIDNILYVESYAKDLRIIMMDRVTVVRHSLSDMEKLLSSYQFIRIHKSYIVNGHYIFSIDAKNVLLTNGISLPLSRYRTEETRRKYQEMIIWDL